MPLPVEEGEYNGDHTDRVEEVRLDQRLDASVADYRSLGSWRYLSTKNYLSLPRAPYSDYRDEGVTKL